MGKSRAPLIKTTRYIGNKWGGKYLRAPDIFFTILEKGKGKLVRLGDIAEVRFGIKTGANEFFYLEPTGKPAPAGYLHVRNGAGWEGEIEEEFLKPVIKSPRECRSILIKPEDLRYKIFMCHRDKSELKGTAALEYIRWGEAQGYHQRPSCRGRQRWWGVGESHTEAIAWAMIHAERHNVLYNQAGIELDHNFFGITPAKSELELGLLWQSVSTLGIMVKELFGRAYGGGSGPIKNERVDLIRYYFVLPSFISQRVRQSDLVSFQSFLTRPLLDIFDEIHQPDRRALDEVVFDVLGLTAGEREAVYEAVVNLVRARLEKARSV